MNQINSAKANRFHGHLDTEINLNVGGKVVTKSTKHYIIQERKVGYRFYLHQHPYVRQLVDRLLRKGTPGLQAADTDYTPDHAALPGSLEVALGSDKGLTVPAGARIALLVKAQAATAGGLIDLAADIDLVTAGAATARLPDGLRATLVAGMSAAPSAGTSFTPPANSQAFLSGDTKIVFTTPATVTLHDGKPGVLPAGIEVLLAGDTLLTLPNAAPVKLIKSKPRPTLFDDFFEATYQPDPALVQRPYPVKDLDFTSSGAYAVYNWELFFHVPMTIAIHLSKNQRYSEAQRWFHYLFDPTDDSDGPTPARFWKVRPFQTTDIQKIEEILVNLATGADETLRNETIRSIEAWKDAPFRPHVIARYRQQAYMYKTVMAYLDNLIAWGDSLFRQDTGEAIDEALMLYVLAANILGPRPQAVPQKGTVRPQTYANLRQDLKQFGTVMRDVEAGLPFDLMPFPQDDESDNDRLATLRSLGQALYFCVPRNDKLLSYWDTVADRLFKIRNSLNFQGSFRQLALFEPPIDPALLARAAAAGLDLGAILNGLNQPLPLVRFQVLVQKAADICQEVKSLGNNLLSAMEKEDGESMTLLRARHEKAVLGMVEQVRYAQLQEATKAKEGLLKTLAMAVQRYSYNERQLGKTTAEVEKAIPALNELDVDSLHKMKFAMEEPNLAPSEITIDIVQGVEALTGGHKLSSHEFVEMNLMNTANALQTAAGVLDLAAAPLSLIPQFQVRVTPWGLGAGGTFGGEQLSKGSAYLASMSRTVGGALSGAAGAAAKIGSYARREQDWIFQSNLAAGEITQVFKQLRGAQIREAIAELELRNHRRQMLHAEEIEGFLNETGTEKNGKVTHKPLYVWMKREVKGLYAQCFQYAFDLAKRAERALQHELGSPDHSFLQYGYLAGKEGLLAGEKLYFDIKRMEMAYHDLNQREFELTKHISLLQVNPLALLQLRATGRCTLQLPESLFDMDGPGHYFRRIKSVAVSIPCVTGPYASINCTLTLLKSTIRKTQVLRDGAYARENAEDDRFSDYSGSLQAIVTSSAQNDSGLFETNLHDERYLPFENSGVISEWQLEMPGDPSKKEPLQFDYNTISDVILHLRYTARAGGGLLRKQSTRHLTERIEAAQAAGSVRLFSVRYEFPSEWARFKALKPDDRSSFELSLTLSQEHYPFWGQGRLTSVQRVDLIASSSAQEVPASLKVYDQVDPAGAATKQETLAKDAAQGNLLVGKLGSEPNGIALPPKPTGTLTLFFDTQALSDLWVAVTWGK